MAIRGRKFRLRGYQALLSKLNREKASREEELWAQIRAKPRGKNYKFELYIKYTKIKRKYKFKCKKGWNTSKAFINSFNPSLGTTTVCSRPYTHLPGYQVYTQNQITQTSTDTTKAYTTPVLPSLVKKSAVYETMAGYLPLFYMQHLEQSGRLRGGLHYPRNPDWTFDVPDHFLTEFGDEEFGDNPFYDN